MGKLVAVVWCTVAHACQIVAWLGGIRSCACAPFAIVRCKEIVRLFALVINLGIIRSCVPAPIFASEKVVSLLAQSAVNLSIVVCCISSRVASEARVNGLSHACIGVKALKSNVVGSSIVSQITLQRHGVL